MWDNLEMGLEPKRGLQIKRIKARNFKSFKDLDVTLGDFNVVIGANSSGKSNFVQIFNFLKHIATHSLDDAVSMQGGAEYLVNFARPNDSVKIEVTFGAVGGPLRIHRLRPDIGFASCKYAFEIRLGGRGSGVICDKLSLDLVPMEGGDQATAETIGHLIIKKGENGGRRIEMEINGEKSKEYSVDNNIRGRRCPLILEDPAFADYFINNIARFFYRSCVYDFDLKAAKNASTIKGMAGLESNGSNLAVVLRNVLQSNENRKLLLNLLADFLPFVEAVDAEKSLGRSVIFAVKERYFKHIQLPPALISDGTASIVAIVLALYFEGNALNVFEAPERSIHPGMGLKLVETFKDASETSQIIVTTHSPELLRHVEIENIFTVARNDKGESKIIKPEKLEEVKQFLDGGVGIDDLFVQKLLGD